MEIWKDIKIKGYEGKYQASVYGEVKNIKTNRILKQHLNNNGYLQVLLCNRGKHKTFNTHRIIASIFISNPNNLPQVNHIDGNKLNNNVENLEWCTGSENQLHAYRNGLKSITEKQREASRNNVKACHKSHEKSVLQYDLENNLIKEWSSIIKASTELNIHKDCISKCCKGKYKTAGKYKWKYKENT